jgi:transcriptional regulator with XRE-family HTH domain
LDFTAETLPIVGCYAQAESVTLCAVSNSASTKLLARIKALRKLHGLTQEAFAEKSGISYKYYQAIEAGRKCDLRLSTLERLANAYGIALWQLFSPALPKPRRSFRRKS